MRGPQGCELAASPQVSDELRVHAIVDSGTTQSMSGIQLMAYVQEQAWGATRLRCIETDDSVRTTFTFCQWHQSEKHPFGPMKHHGCLWFALVET